MVGCRKREKYVPELVTLPAAPWVGCESKDKEGCLTPVAPDAPWRPLQWGTLQRCPAKMESKPEGGGREAARRWGLCATSRT